MYKLSRFSWGLAIVYLVAFLTMEYHSSNQWEGFCFSIPLIIMTIIWSEKAKKLIDMDDRIITKKEAFRRDLFLIFYGFILSFLLSMLFEYDNADVLGWWPVILLLVSLYGMLFAVSFSLMALLLGNHKRYTVIFSIVILLLMTFMPTYIPIPFLGRVGVVHVCMGLLICTHLFLCLGYKVWTVLSIR